MNDQLSRGIIAPLDVRFVLADCPETAETIILKHNCDPVSAHLLSRAVGASVLVSALLTEDERYTLRWNYQGKLSTILADCDAQSHVRAFINPPNLSQLCQTEQDIYGEEGTMTLIKSNAAQTLSSGTTKAPLLDVVEDLAFYLSYSDQVETAMAVLVGFRADPQHPVKICRGAMLQALPGCDLVRFDRLRQKLVAPECRGLLSHEIVQDNLVERFAMELSKGETSNHDFTLEATSSPRFACSCSRSRMLSALKLMGQEELGKLFQERSSARVSCQFCNTTYEFTAQDFS